MDTKKFLLDYESSGLSQRAFGALSGMSQSSVAYYLGKARREIKNKELTEHRSQVESFVPVSMPLESDKSSTVVIELPRGIVVRIIT